MLVKSSVESAMRDPHFHTWNCGSALPLGEGGCLVVALCAHHIVPTLPGALKTSQEKAQIVQPLPKDPQDTVLFASYPPREEAGSVFADRDRSRCLGAGLLALD